MTSSEESPIIGFGGFAVSRDEVNKILGLNNPMGYIEKVRSEVKRFKEEKLKNNKVACVYLTGGASRMDFVRQIFMDVFNLNENQCSSDDNPSVIVSQGVAHLSYADIITAQQEEELREIAQTAISQYNWAANIRNIVNKSIKEKIIDKAWDVMISYKMGNVYESLKLSENCYDNHYIGMEYEEDGYQRVRNIRALDRKFESTFEALVDYDFAAECEQSITSNIVDSVIRKLKTALQAFEYNPSSSKILKITGLSASITKSGAKQLSTRFTGEDEGHIIYDAVKSCYPFGAMIGWDIYKDRWDADRKQHYDYYRKNDSDIFGSYTWGEFLKNKIKISGIDSAKQQTKSYIDSLVDDYVSYAKLAIFFN